MNCSYSLNGSHRTFKTQKVNYKTLSHQICLGHSWDNPNSISLFLVRLMNNGNLTMKSTTKYVKSKDNFWLRMGFQQTGDMLTATSPVLSQVSHVALNWWLLIEPCLCWGEMVERGEGRGSCQSKALLCPKTLSH